MTRNPFAVLISEPGRFARSIIYTVYNKVIKVQALDLYPSPGAHAFQSVSHGRESRSWWYRYSSCAVRPPDTRGPACARKGELPSERAQGWTSAARPSADTSRPATEPLSLPRLPRAVRSPGKATGVSAPNLPRVASASMAMRMCARLMNRQPCSAPLQAADRCVTFSQPWPWPIGFPDTRRAGLQCPGPLQKRARFKRLAGCCTSDRGAEPRGRCPCWRSIFTARRPPAAPSPANEVRGGWPAGPAFPSRPASQPRARSKQTRPPAKTPFAPNPCFRACMWRARAGMGRWGTQD
ncbi:hypothetical protein BS78_06G082600 [Paspalum vaginatum]|nr:hypothetical protein BS78_06G082600 [Paspalum vaginatum]